MIWFGIVAIIVVIVIMIIDLKNNYYEDGKSLLIFLYSFSCIIIFAFTYFLCSIIPPIPIPKELSESSTKSIEITEFKIIEDNTLKDDYLWWDTNEYTYTTADNIVHNNVKVDILGDIKDGSITSIEVQSNTPDKLIITENQNFDLRTFFVVTTYEYTFV